VKIFFRYFETLRHLSPSQIRWRVWYRVRKTLGIQPRLPEQTAPPAFNSDTLARLRQHAAARASTLSSEGEVCDALLAGRFVFLSKSEQADQPPWETMRHGRLWAYQLHSFHWADALLREQRGADKLLDWIHDWIARNPPGADVAWDAYCISNRLLWWALAEAVFGWNDERMRRSYADQMAWLLQSIEWDLRANHLLKNACALAVAGNLLGGEATHQSRTLLEEEVGEQVLEDGGHIERSPMYHALALEDLLIAYASYRDKPVYLRGAIAHMADWLAEVMHPDGDIPLFGDSVLGEAPVARELAELARVPVGEEATRLPLGTSGIHVRECGGMRLVAKSAGAEPAYQPGHTHADIFTYELSVDGKRFIVDTGVHGYAESPWRHYCRSVRAHNAFTVDGCEPIETWSTFRVARRCRVTLDERDGGLRMRHDGYAPGEYTRSFELGESELTVRDAFSDRGRARSFIHLHPAVEVERVKEGYVLRRGNTRVLLRAVSGHLMHRPPAAEPPDGWYFERFGDGKAAHGFELALDLQPADAIAYALTRIDRRDVVA